MIQVIRISHSANEMRKRRSFLMVIERVSVLVVDEWPDLSRGVNDDVIVTDCRRKGETITRVGNIYNHCNTELGERLA